MDRVVILSHLQRHPRDPFTHAPLTAAELIPQPELQARIVEWNEKRKDGSRTSESAVVSSAIASVSCSRCVAEDVIAVSAHALGQLVSEDGGDLPTEVMEALIEAEKLSAAAKRAEQVAHDAEAASRYRPKRRWAGERGEW
jgi:U-box domain